VLLLARKDGPDIDRCKMCSSRRTRGSGVDTDRSFSHSGSDKRLQRDKHEWGGVKKRVKPRLHGKRLTNKKKKRVDVQEEKN